MQFLSLGGIWSKAGCRGIESISGWMISMISSQTLDPSNPNGYVASSAREIKDSLAAMLATIPYLCTVRLSQCHTLLLCSVKRHKKRGNFNYFMQFVTPGLIFLQHNSDILYYSLIACH